jgi:serine protease Do
MQFRNLILIALLGCGAHTARSQAPTAIRAANVPTAGYLGVMLQDVSAEMAKALKLPEEAGVEVTRLDPNSPAALAGIKVDDVVMQYNGQRVESQDQFKRMVRETPAGREVSLQIYRNGAFQIIKAKLAPVPPYAGQSVPVPLSLRSQPFQGASPDVPLSRMSWGIGILGAELESLEGQLAFFFGVKEGVLVRSVTRGSVADKAGLKAGDVITRVGDAQVTAPADVSGHIRAGRGQSATLTVWRDRKEISLTVALDSNRPGPQ